VAKVVVEREKEEEEAGGEPHCMLHTTTRERINPVIPSILVRLDSIVLPHLLSLSIYLAGSL
jgi:hypothetical protein